MPVDEPSPVEPIDQPQLPQIQQESDSQLKLRLELAPGTRLQVTIEAHASDGTPLETHTLTIHGQEIPTPDSSSVAGSLPESGVPAPPPWMRPWIALRSFRLTWQNSLFFLALIIYLVTRLAALTDFPIYFFTDEAVQTVLAADFIRDDLHSYTSELLPTFFVNGNQYNLSISVYAQILPYLLFGKSVFATRAVSAILSLLAALWVGLALKNIYQSKVGWAGVLLVAVTPVWFLHSRTAFETVLATTFYAGFLYYYSLYRTRSPKSIYAAVILGALAFYSYSPAQMVLALTTLLLIISDARYHWQQRKWLLRAFGLGLLLVLPYIRFLINHPGENQRHMQILNSYWIQDISVWQKLGQFFTEYLRGLNPVYWYSADPPGLIRHAMRGYGHLWRPGLLLFVPGLILCLRHFRQTQYRLPLLALLAAPSGAALAELGVTRALFIIIPVAWISGIALSELAEWLVRAVQPRLPRWPLRAAVTGMLFFLIAFSGLLMAQDAVTNGPTWYDDYGLSGLQYGGEHIFRAIQDYLAEHPQTRLIFSPSWANGTDVIARFFFSDPLPFEMGSIEGYFIAYQEIKPTDLFVMIPEEFNKVKESNKFTDIQVERIVNYPNGSPGFYFTRLRYADNILEIFEAERALRRVLMREMVTLPDGSTAEAAFSHLDMGVIQHAFDGNEDTLIRSLEANPLRIELTLPAARTLNAIRVRVGGVATRLTVKAYAPGSQTAQEFSQEVPSSPAPRNIDLTFPAALEADRLVIEVLSVNDQEPAHVHLWEVWLK